MAKSIKKIQYYPNERYEIQFKPSGEKITKNQEKLNWNAIILFN